MKLLKHLIYCGFLLSLAFFLTAMYSVSFLDGTIYDYFGHALVAVGVCYILISLWHWYKKMPYMFITFHTGLALLLSGLYISVYYYGYSTMLAENPDYIWPKPHLFIFR
ncbi:hypothetical protein SAMN05444266_10575 [Chitinophaga jiangningensis]|uniref:Uncharacterized protein n=1 Tax=Chitinophaga jiangningensis TaxID=1419482 RepID=A0A1M7DPE9_9BACT|nr:hypothetical protein [Chitinophaga jiangningensis]SHL81277.1 hypothetical protein SAMN05444266_10575 [Chitinophaga jiangningensis]